jgi:hypothetical protein
MPLPYLLLSITQEYNWYQSQLGRQDGPASHPGGIILLVTECYISQDNLGLWWTHSAPDFSLASRPRDVFRMTTSEIFSLLVFLFNPLRLPHLKPHCIPCSHFMVDDISALKPSSKPPVEDNVTASLHQQLTPWPWLRPGCRDDVTWIC